jgi:hypothetical protein
MRAVANNGLRPKTISLERHRKSHVFSIDRIEKQLAQLIKKKHNPHLALMMVRGAGRVFQTRSADERKKPPWPCGQGGSCQGWWRAFLAECRPPF